MLVHVRRVTKRLGLFGARAAHTARTVAVPQGAIGTAAQLLNDALPKEASRFLVARDSFGKPLSLGDKIDQHAESVTYIPFDDDDTLGRRAMWLSAALMFGSALHTVVPGSTIATLGASGDGNLDATAGFVCEAILDQPDAVPRHGTLSEMRAAVDDALAAFASVQRSKPTPRLEPEQLAALEKELKRLAGANLSFVRQDVSLDEAWELFSRNPFRLKALLAGPSIPERIPIVRLQNTQFADLWHGDEALLRRTKPIKASRILNWSTAALTSYVPGSDGGVQPLLRIRGVSFPSADALQEFSNELAERERSDHRALGLAQSLFFTHDTSPGSAFVLPHGMRLLRKVERVIRDLYDAFGYEEVQTPQLFRSTLWKQSGHWDKYREDMFSAQGFAERSCCGGHAQQDDELFGIKPMNCPGHCVMYSSRSRSYRELPLRLAEFGPLHRNEASGALSGLTRVRRFHQDDAHVFCAPVHVGDEIKSMLHMLALAYRVFGFGDRFELVLSTRPDNYIGDLKVWEHAEASLKAALDASGRPWALNEGDGAFYGPKIDIRLVDAMGRKHQTATIQLDFQLPERFKLEYAVPEDSPEAKGATIVRPGVARPVMIHRAILGSFERFFAIIIEQCRGWWPFWMSPRQAVILPTVGADNEEVSKYVEHVRNFISHGDTFGTSSALPDPFVALGDAAASGASLRTRFYVDVNQNQTLGKRIRDAQLARYNFVLVVGPHEAQNNTVGVRLRDEKAAPEWISTPDGRRVSVQTLIHEVIQKYFSREVPSRVDLGEWKLDELRSLFCILDAMHV
ncbi:threonine--tRNA ligase [Malassezia cuniculi]|uniref:threonine--tRNA ligase n=1 Tax=Malassezia cuniculi TaxID=948313 RepID=A0AAF0J5F1_9BASI|nr:threonine--tRNA ligase [Malassezia cuniculi]